MADVVRDLDALTETRIEHQSKHFILRSASTGTCGKVFGVALPPTAWRLDESDHRDPQAQEVDDCQVKRGRLGALSQKTRPPS